jgi:hypothetical protein
MAVLIVGLVATGEAAAQFCEAEKTRYRAKGDGVSADFSSVDTSTCALGIETTVHVDASVGVVHVEHVCGSGSTHQGDVTVSYPNLVNVFISVYDRCLGMTVRSVTGTGEADELHVQQNRKTATLRAAFEGTDELDQPVSLAIDLVWDGVGHDEHSSNHVNINERVYRLVFSSIGTIRDADAAGSVAIDGTDQTPLHSTRGTIEKDARRELEVYR